MPVTGTSPRALCSPLAPKGCHVSSEPVRQPANDLVAFDVRKQSPEQIARMFARWKEQRKRLEAQESARSAPPAHLKPVPAIASSRQQESVPQTPRGPERDGPIHYSTSFEEVLAAREPTLAQRVWNPNALPKLARPHPPRRRSGTKWILAGAASIVAVAAVAGGALWEQSTARTNRVQADAKPATNSSPIARPAEAARPAAPSHPMEIPMAEPFVAATVALDETEWPLQQAVDLALMTSAPVAETARLPLMPQLKPPVPAVQTASKTAQPQVEPNEPASARVDLPPVSGVTSATVSAPVAPAAEARIDDARPDRAVSRGNDKSDYTFGSRDRVASSSSGPSAGGSEADPGSGGLDGAGTGGSGDPSGGDTDGAGSGSGGDPDGGDSGGDDSGSGDGGGGDTDGGDSGGDSGGGDAGGGDSDGGNSGSDSGGGDSGSDAGGGESGGGESGDGESGGGESGGDDSGGGDAGGGESGGNESGDGESGGGESGGDDSGGGDSGEGGEGGESGEDGSAGGGIGGAIGGALGGLGDALGGALGGGQGSASGDKDKDKDKDKGKGGGEGGDKGK
jgi:hypothetical protein